MITFYLIRHGQKEETFGDPALTPLGREQAEKTAGFLKNKSISLLFASPMRRTKETASFLSRSLDLMINTDNRLKERLNWGEIPNESLKEFLVEWAKTDFDHSYIATHGKSSEQTGEHMRSFIDEVSQHNDDMSIILVSHGGAIGDLLRNLFGEGTLPTSIDPKTNSPHIAIDECSITTIEQVNGTYTLKGLNEKTHLENRG